MLAVGIYFFFFSVTNGLYISVMTKKKKLEKEPFVSVLIPARNEEENISNCLDSFLNQEYSNYEIVVLDDNSSDRTPQILEEYVKNNPTKIRVIKGKKLPADWRGKCYAMKQLTENAEGEYFLCTDADTIHTPKSISFMMSNMIYHNLDMVSGYIGQKIVSFGEKLCVPLIYMMTALAIPLWLNQKLKFETLSTAIGQFIGLKAETMRSIGGYDRLKRITTEDVYLARIMKREGFKTMFLDFKNCASCRMYPDYKKASMGIAKNIFDFLGKHSMILIPIAIILLPVLCFPFPLLIRELYRVFVLGIETGPWFYALVINNVLVFISWLLICISRRISALIAFMYPLLFVNLSVLVVMSWSRSKRGKGYMWKGRVVY